MKSEFTRKIEQAFFEENGEYPVWFDGQPELKEESAARLKRMNAKQMIDTVRPSTTRMGDMGI